MIQHLMSDTNCKLNVEFYLVLAFFGKKKKKVNNDITQVHKNVFPLYKDQTMFGKFCVDPAPSV